MKSVLTKPHQLFIVASIAFFIASFFALHEKAIDVVLHDTYWVIAMMHVYWLISLLFLIYWGIYKATFNLLLSPALTWIHAIITISGIAIVFAVGLSLTNRGEFKTEYESMNEAKTAYALINAAGFLWLFGQLIYPFNLLGGIIKRKWMKK